MTRFATEDKLHIEIRQCGIFVVGEDNCILAKDWIDALRIYREISGNDFFHDNE